MARLHATHAAVDTILAGAGCEVDASTGAITPPIHLTSTFERDADLAYSRGFCYSRISNPTRNLFERAIAAAETPALQDAPHGGAGVGDAAPTAAEATAALEGGALVTPSAAAEGAPDPLAAAAAAVAAVVRRNDAAARGAGLRAEAAAFASGMAAVCTIFQAVPGGHVLLSDDVYHGVRFALQTSFAHWGLAYTLVDMSDLAAVESALLAAREREGAVVGEGTTLVWLETPSNPCCKVVDVAAVARLAHDDATGGGALVVVDATWCTPCAMRPLELGADLVLHSATKYLGGHSDLTGGAVVGWTTHSEAARGGGGGGSGTQSSGGAAPPPPPPAPTVTRARADAVELFRRVRQLQGCYGAVMAPFDCWLCLRGMRSLGARMRMHCSNAMAVAEALAVHDKVSAVYYAGLPGHPGHAVAAAQMGGRFGGMLSFRVAGGREAAVAVAARLRVFRRATSLGGTESLVEHRRSIEPPDSATPDDLLRISVGIEAPEAIVADLLQALA